MFLITSSLERKAELPVLEEGWRRRPELMARVTGYRNFLSSSCGLGETSGNLAQPLILPDLKKNPFFLSVFPAVKWILESIWMSCHRDCPMHKPSFTQQAAAGFQLCWEHLIDYGTQHGTAELVWLLQRYVLACPALPWLSHNFKIHLSFSNNKSFYISVYLRLI